MNEDEYTKNLVYIYFPYWYDIINQRVSLHSNFYMRTLFTIWLLRWFTDIMMNIEIDWETKKESHAGGATYDDEEKVNFIAMRIIGFGLIEIKSIIFILM